ncbi:hypothetical protein ACFVFQ_24505 [Streptomyces sp. NPDC057743]|uniref:hypothetical protein n=1 Tax=Streptomyces sp. NPDC057743 TaxID=3346236 RepID=UPI00368C405D
MSTDEQQRAALDQDDIDSPRGRLLAGIADLVDTFTAETSEVQQKAAEERAALLHAVAAEYGPERTADEITLAEAGRIRRAYKLVEEATPRLIVEAHEREGKSATEIATTLGCSPSYASRVLREHRATAGE